MSSLATSFGRSLRRAALTALPILGSTALADEVPQPAPEVTPAPAEDKGDQTLLGDLGGLRPALTPHGLTFGASETSEVLGNLTGGFRRGAQPPAFDQGVERGDHEQLQHDRGDPIAYWHRR